MGSKPIPLSNYGAKCYLNTCIQAVSACDTFVKKIEDLNFENVNLQKLNLFDALMKKMNGKSGKQDISKNPVFTNWNKPGQQDTYELLSHIINEIYAEIKAYKESIGDIDKRDNCQWLDTNLPLRIKMENEIICKCGQIDKTPMQTDIALHLSFPSSDRAVFNMEYLLDNHFKEEKIQDYKCEKGNCTGKDVIKKMTLGSPFPDTICIHLQRLRWECNRMRKINATVLFCNRLTMRREYANGSDSGDNTQDVYYYLKSVIVHYGGESSGHYACYKKTGTGWFYVDDSTVKESSIESVFACNPYILFYERAKCEVISPTIVKVDKSLNIFIHAIVSCSDIDDWLHMIDSDNDIKSITLLVYLWDFANGYVTKDESLDKELNMFWGNKRSVYETLISVFGGVPKISSSPGEKWFKENVPFGNLVVNTFQCKCGYRAPSPPQLYRSIDITVSTSNENLQALFDNFCDEAVRSGELCNKKECSDNQGRNSRRFCRPLAKTICIWFQHLSKSTSVTLYNELIITKRHCTDSKQDSDVKYILRSVVPIGGGICYRVINGRWKSVSDSCVKCVPQKEVLSWNPRMLVLQLEESERPNERNEAGSCGLESGDSKRRGRDTDCPFTPNLGFSDLFNHIIHSLSACSSFIEWLTNMKYKGSYIRVASLSRIIKLSTGMTIDDGGVEVAAIERWNDLVSTSGIALIGTILKDIFEEIGTVDSSNEVYQPMMMLNLIDKNSVITEPSINITVSSTSYNPKKSFQQILNDGIELYSNTDSSVVLLLGKGDPSRILLKDNLPKTICVNIPHNYDGILTSLELILTNELCSKRPSTFNREKQPECLHYGKCCRKYSLKSVISKGNKCYKFTKNRWYKLTGYNSSVWSQSDLDDIVPVMLFYE